MMSDPLTILLLLALWGAFLVWTCGDQARRVRERLAYAADRVLARAELAVALAGWACVGACVAFWAAGVRLVGWGRRVVFPKRRVEGMTDGYTIGYIRRDVMVAAELAAVAEAAVRSMQETGGTPLERAGVLRVLGIARGGATSAIEQLDAVARREWAESLGEPSRRG